MIKTLVINGSPRKDGDTSALIEELTRHLDGEVKIISCFDRISPCIDCRFCWTHKGCAVQDDMQKIYEYLVSCNNVVLASPVWFSSLSGPALNIGSRFQTYFAAKKFRGEPVMRLPKKGLILLTGAQPGSEASALRSAEIILRLAGAEPKEISAVISMNTDVLPAGEDQLALNRLQLEAERLNEPPGMKKSF